MILILFILYSYQLLHLYWSEICCRNQKIHRCVNY